jgi:hypothetical protein
MYQMVNGKATTVKRLLDTFKFVVIDRLIQLEVLLMTSFVRIINFIILCCDIIFYIYYKQIINVVSY